MRFFGERAVYDMSNMGLPAFEGIDAIRWFVTDWYRSYERADDELYEGTLVGNGVVFAILRETARPFESSAHVHARYGLVVAWSDEQGRTGHGVPRTSRRHGRQPSASPRNGGR